MALVPQRAAQPRLRSDRSMFSASDDNAMMKQIVATHAPDGRDFSVKPLLLIVEDIFNRAAPDSSITDIVHQQQATQQAQLDALEEKTLQNGFHEMLDMLSYTINKISCELSCKCSGGGDAHATTLGIFNIVSNCTWDAKVVLALAAFAVSYGEFWLTAQLYPTNPLAKGVALLKQLPDIFEQAEALKPKFDALSNLIKAMMDVAKCIVEFKELPSQYIAADTPEILVATAHIPTAVYWTIRSIVACTSQIFGLIGMGNEYTSSTTEAWELSSLAHKVNNIYSHLKKQLYFCHRHIDEKKDIETYQILIRLFEIIHIDNMKILKALISARDDQMPLFDGSAKKRVSLDVLRRKTVLLLISDFDLAPEEELKILKQMYSRVREHPQRTESQYEIVWLPVLDQSTPWDETKQKQFQKLQSEMPWYSVYHPSMIEPAVIKYIKEIWHFKKRPLLVVLDPQGKVANPNAIHMMWIWHSLAFPFTSAREDALWKEETWRIELLADNVHPNISYWVAERKVICLYGGEDIDWIRKFTRAAKAVAGEANIELEMLYVGKSSPRERVKNNNKTIVEEGLSHVLDDLASIRVFWVRLESMWHSKVQHNRTIEDDPIMHEIMAVLSYDSSDQGWAVLCKGGALEMAKSKGDNLMTCFEKFSSWKQSATEIGFVPALIDKLRELHSTLHCTRLILPGASGTIPDKVVCAECGRPMEKFFMYRCCTD